MLGVAYFLFCINLVSALCLLLLTNETLYIRSITYRIPELSSSVFTQVITERSTSWLPTPSKKAASLSSFPSYLFDPTRSAFLPRPQPVREDYAVRIDVNPQEQDFVIWMFESILSSNPFKAGFLAIPQLFGLFIDFGLGWDTYGNISLLHVFVMFLDRRSCKPFSKALFTFNNYLAIPLEDCSSPI